jgi:hypothetical protein
MLLAACGAPMNLELNGVSPQPLGATLKCVASMADSLGYKPLAVNHGQGIEATHKDSVLAPYEDGRLDKLTASGANSEKNEGASSLRVIASSFSLHWTRIGLESQEIPASDDVRAAALKIMTRCGSAEN